LDTDLGTLPILGHYGGIDEIGIYLVPGLLALLALRWSDRRARGAAEDKIRVDLAEGNSETAEDEG
jgi:hypothetical protein